MTSFDVLQLLKQLEVVAHGAHDRDEASDVFRMSPSGVVTSAIGVGDERGAMHVARAWMADYRAGTGT